MADTNKLFIWATKNKVRFDTNQGKITVEDLWDLPLTSRSKTSLDTVAKTLHRQLKEAEEISFVQENNKQSVEAEAKLEIVKHVIYVRMEANKAVREAAERKQQKEEIRRILDEKDKDALRNKSPEELRRMLEE